MSLSLFSLLLTLTLISPLSVTSRESRFFSKVTANNNNPNPADQFSSYHHHNSEFQQWPQMKNTDDQTSRFEAGSDQVYRFQAPRLEPQSDSEMKNDDHPMRSHLPEEFVQQSDFINDEESHRPEEFQRKSDFVKSEQFSRFQPTEEIEKPIESQKNNGESQEPIYRAGKNNEDEFSRWNEFEKQNGEMVRGYERNDEMAASMELESEEMKNGKKEEEMGKEWKPERSTTRKEKGQQEGMSDTRYLENGRYFYDLEKEDMDRYGEQQGSRGGYFYQNGQQKAAYP